MSSPHSSQPPLTKYPLPAQLQNRLVNSLRTKVMEGVTRREVMPLYEWTMRYRRFDGVPPQIIPMLKNVYDDMHHELIIMKAAQVFISEYAINIALWGADQGWAERGVVLYVFPKQEQMDDFSQDRVGRAIAGSTYLQERILQTDRADNANRARLRKVGGRPVYFRGSDSIAQARSVDADIVICDEVDLFKLPHEGETGNEGAIERVRQRLGSSKNPLFRAFSQPLYPDGPVDMLFKTSDQRHYYLKCEACGEKQPLVWERNVEVKDKGLEARVICYRCRKPMNRLMEGEWVAHEPANDPHGYHISKLYSPRMKMADLVRKFKAQTDPGAIQSFYNADLGLPYRPQGTPGLGDFSREQYNWLEPSFFETWEKYMGVDTGRTQWITVVGRPNSDEPFRLIFREGVDRFEHTGKDTKGSVEWWWSQFKPRLTIIDGQGEPLMAQEWSEKHVGRVLRWFHKPAAIEAKYPENSDEVHYHRTAFLDNLYAVLRTHQVILHVNAGTEFYNHLGANVREIIKDKDGRLQPRYLPLRADHYAFSLGYAILASGARPATSPITIIGKPTDRAAGSGIGAAIPKWTGVGERERNWTRWR